VSLVREDFFNVSVVFVPYFFFVASDGRTCSTHGKDEKYKTDNILVGNTEEKDSLGERGIREKTVLKLSLNE
jgi:hypothetical protein